MLVLRSGDVATIVDCHQATPQDRWELGTGEGTLRICHFEDVAAAADAIKVWCNNRRVVVRRNGA